MSFFFASAKIPNTKKGAAPANRRKGVTPELLHKMECKLCPLREYHSKLHHPDMTPSGAEDAEIYFLAEAPGADEDLLGEPLVGQSGQLIKTVIAEPFVNMQGGNVTFDEINEHCLASFRFGNTVRTRPPENRTPVWEEIEACRPSVIRDIEKVKPKIIVALGGVALAWALTESSAKINDWRGRYVPVRIGKHVCWLTSTFHPSFILRTCKKSKFNDDVPVARKMGWKSTVFEKLGINDAREEFRAFKSDIQTAMSRVHDIEDAEDYLVPASTVPENITSYDGTKPDHFKKVVAFLNKAIKAKRQTVDIETWPLKPYNDNSLLLSIAIGRADHVVSIALEHKDAGWTDQQLDKIFELLYVFFTNGKIKIAHHAQFEMEWLGHYLGWEIVWKSEWYCTESQGYMLDRRRGTLGLDFLCTWRFGLPLKSQYPLDKKNMHREDLEVILEYNGSDTKHTDMLYDVQQVEVDEAGLTPILQEQYRRLRTTTLAQLKGIPVDQKTNRKLGRRLQRKMEKADSLLKKMKAVKKYEHHLGIDFNPASPKQVAELYEYLYPSESKDWGIIKHIGAGGAKSYTSDESVLSLIMVKEKENTPAHKIAKLVLERRSAAGDKSKYIDSVTTGGKMMYDDGLAHPNFNSNLTATRRTSSSDPNFQNFPSRKNKFIRSEICPGEDHMVVSCDYGQIEARILGVASNDKKFIQALWDDYDIHMEWALRLAKAYPQRIGTRQDIEDPKIMKAFRGDVKNQWSFPLFYGALAPSVSANIRIPQNIVERHIEMFWKEFATIREWQEKQIKFYSENGYLYSLTGFRFLPPMDRNKLLNYSIQGSASDITVDAWNRLSEMARKTGKWDLQAPINVHDDLTFMVAKEELEETTDTIIGQMLACPFDFIKQIPLVVEASVGPDWGSQDSIGDFRSDKWKGSVAAYKEAA